MTWKKILLWPEREWAKIGMDHSIKLFAVDLPGAGDSPEPADTTDYRVRKQAEKLRQVLAPLCKEWVVVGNSMGGWIAAWLGLDWSEGVRRLILVDSAGLKSEFEKGKNLLTNPTVESMKDFQRRAYYRPRPIPDWQWRVIVERAWRSHAREIQAAQISEDTLDMRLPTLRRPSLLIWGKEDQIIPISTGYQMRSLLPGAIWREIPECGHLPQKECPLPILKAIVDMIHFGVM